MTETTRNRLLGAVLLLPALAWIIATPGVSEIVSKGASILAGAALAAGVLLLVTGEFLWISAEKDTSHSA
jgi:hypothetical protein